MTESQYFLISKSEIDQWQTVTPMSPMCQELRERVRSRPAKESSEKVLDDEDVLYPIPSRENCIKIQSIASLLMDQPQKISKSTNPLYIMNHIGKALSYLMRNDPDGEIEYKAIKNMIELRQECEG